MYTRSPYQGHRRRRPPQLALTLTLTLAAPILSLILLLSPFACSSLAHSHPPPLQPTVSPVELIYQSIRRSPRDHATTIRPSCTGSSLSVPCYRICVACSFACERARVSRPCCIHVATTLTEKFISNRTLLYVVILTYYFNSPVGARKFQT